jgi:hypothetical protein
MSGNEVIQFRGLVRELLKLLNIGRAKGFSQADELSFSFVVLGAQFAGIGSGSAGTQPSNAVDIEDDRG